MALPTPRSGLSTGRPPTGAEAEVPRRAGGTARCPWTPGRARPPTRGVTGIKPVGPRETPPAPPEVPAHRWSGHPPRPGCRRRSRGQPALPAADPAGPRRHAGRSGQRLHGAEPETGEQHDTVRQHVVRLTRPHPGVRTAHHPDTGPQHPNDVGPALLESDRIGGRQRRPPGQPGLGGTDEHARRRESIHRSRVEPNPVRGEEGGVLNRPGSRRGS